MKKNQIIKDLMNQYDRSFYLYDEIVIEEQIDKLKKNFPDFEFLYSVKANPYNPVVNFIKEKDFGMDAASEEEVHISERLGLEKEKILYSTPGKTKKNIENTIDKAIIIADSYNELKIIDEVARENNEKVKVGLRINISPVNSEIPMSSKFGVDAIGLLDNKDLFESLTNIEIVGIHVHLRSQILDYEILYRYYEKVFNTAVFCMDILGWNIEFINFGGGLGIVYSEENDTPLDMEKLQNKCSKLVRQYKQKLNARLIIETGRFITCYSGTYVTKVVDIKESMGIKYIVVEKGLNGFMRPSIAELLMDYSGRENLKASEPLFTAVDAFDFNILDKDKNFEKVNLVGSLCTATDVMAKGIELPKAEIGDIVTVSKAGSYAYSLSPVLFASHPMPLQIYLTKDEDLIIEELI